MEKKKPGVLNVPAAGIIYGQITYWLVLVGMVVTLAGSIMCMVPGDDAGTSNLFNLLWQGDSAETIWESCTSVEGPRQGYWYLRMLPAADGVAMLGIAVCGIAAVVGMWGASAAVLRDRQGTGLSLNRLYFVFALVVAVVLTLSALGILKFPE